MLVVPEAPHQWSWPSGTSPVYLSISLTLCSISVSAEIGSFISLALPVTLIFPLILFLLLFMIYSLSLSYLMLLNGWDDGFCGRKQKDPVLYPSQSNDWTCPSTVGDGNPTAAPPVPHCPVCEMPGSPQGTRLSGIKEPPGWGSSPRSAPEGLSALPWACRWDLTLPSEPSSSSAMPQLLSFRSAWDGQDSEQQDTTSVSGRLLPTLGFFITRTPRCSWLWEVFCPHTK